MDLESYNVSFELITETHFKTKHSDALLTIEGCYLFRRDKLGRRAGGVVIYAEESQGAQVWDSDGSRAREEEVLRVRLTIEKNNIHQGHLPPSPIYDTVSQA